MRVELGAPTPPVGNLSGSRQPHEAIAGDRARDARQCRHELRCREQLRVVAERVQAADGAKSRVLREEEFRCRGHIVMRRRAGGKVVAADAADEDEGIAADREELGGRGTRIVRAEQVAATGGEPGGHCREVELFLWRTQTGGGQSEPAREIVLRRLEAPPLIGEGEPA